MIDPEDKSVCRLDDRAVTEREQQRLSLLAELGLLEAESVPVFEEAVQTAAHFLDLPVCILGLIDQDRQWLKSAVGLSRLGLMNELAASRQLPRRESLCTHVIETGRVLAINDTTTNPAFASTLLVQQYGIRSYLGVPLLTSTGHCLGTLAVMDLVPHTFTRRQIEFLELTARWSMSEFERGRLAKAQLVWESLPAAANGRISATRSINATDTNTTDLLVDRYPNQKIADSEDAAIDAVMRSPLVAVPTAKSGKPLVKIELLTQLTQELRTPLTSVMGMASVLNREVYGPLTDKQKEYLDIIHHSGQYLLSLVNEIVELGMLDDGSQALSLASVDVEMLCQQAIGTLEQAAKRREQQIYLSVEPGYRIWLLDKEKVRQLLYHLIFSVIQSANASSIVRVHVSRKDQGLNIAVWVSHPWLGEGLPQAEMYAQETSTKLQNTEAARSEVHQPIGHKSKQQSLYGSKLGAIAATQEPGSTSQFGISSSRGQLGLLLSRQLAEMHGGQILIQGSLEVGYRYVVSLPQRPELEANLLGT